MGHTTVELAEQIVQSRVTYNDSLATQGPEHPSTLDALAKLNRLQRTARTLFAK